MQWFLDVAYIGITASWRWLLGSAAVVAALVALLFGVGVLGGGGGEAEVTPTVITASPTPTPKPLPARTPVPVPTRAAAIAPTALPPAAKLISVSILATLAKDVGSLEFVLVYDPAKLEFDQLERGILAGNALIDSSSAVPGRLWAAIVDFQGMNGSGSVAVVKFKVRDDAGGTMPLTLEGIAAFDANTLVDIATVTTAGEFNGAGLSPLSPIVTFQ